LNYRYFADLNNNEYRWSIQTNDDGYYTCRLYKFKTNNMWGSYTLVKSMQFRKRNMAKSWCLKLVRKARARQEIVLNARAERKQTRLDAKPTYTKDELRVREAQDKIDNYNRLITRANTKLKIISTRKSTYEKKIRVMQKRIDKVELIA